MALDKAKVIIAPFTLKLLDGSQTEIYSVGPLKSEAIAINADEGEEEIEIEDGSKVSTLLGKSITVECTFSELDPADLDTIESSDVASVKIEYGNNKVLTINNLQPIKTSVDNKKTKVTIKGSAAIGETWSSLFTIT